jgi:hypothetical protein
MDTIAVAVRMRPLNRRELDGGKGQTWLLNGNSVTQCAPTGASRAHCSPTVPGLIPVGR